VCVVIRCLECIVVFVVGALDHNYITKVLYFGLITAFTLMPDSWLEVSIQKVLRPAISTQVFLGFPGSKSEC
jgi:hypothetical protein